MTLQQHQWSTTMPLKLTGLLTCYEDTNYQLLIKFHHNWLKQDVGQLVLRSMNLWIIFWIRNKELPEQWKELIIVPIYKMGDKTDRSKYKGISLLSITYKILSNIFLSRLTPYAEGIIWDHQCGFRHNRSTTDHISCNPQKLEKKWVYEAVHQLFIVTNQTYNSDIREVLFSLSLVSLWN